MYISHKYKLIFLRTPKTASSSLSEFFIKNIPDDYAIYTPVEDSNIPGTLNPNIINKYKINFKYYHFTLEDLVNNEIITEEQAKTYKSFAVIRDPVDRQKSFYYFYKNWKGRHSPASLDEYKAWTSNGSFIGEPNSAIKQTDILSINEEIIGNYWLYENINDELNNLMNELHLPVKHPLTNHKNGYRKNRDNEIVFDDQSMSDLRNAFTKDFEIYESLYS